MTIHNGTKSERTSFALYGTLSSGATINGISGNIFICVGPITVKSDQTLPGESAPGNQTFAVGTITFTCGQDLTLTDNLLAWTDASGTTADRCNTFSNATECAAIQPKCGSAASITIKGPVVPPSLDKVDPTCTTSTGTVTVSSTKTNLLFSLDGGTFAAYPSGGFTGLSSGQHCVRVKNADGCISPAACKTIGTVPANPARPVVTLQEATICGTLTSPTITVSCPIAGTYTLTQTGVSGSQTKTYPTDNPVKFTVQAGKPFHITVTNTDGCTSAETNCDNYTSNSCPSGPITTRTATNVNVVLPDEQSTVVPAPNPFNDKIRFSIQSAVTGQGSLELYNMLGQKVKTIYQGHFAKGETRTIEYQVPGSQRVNLVYVFRVGNQKTSGKLIGLK
jgi:hypothetical protein